MESIPPPFPSAAPPPLPTPKRGAGKWVLIGCGGCLGLIVLGVVFSVGVYFLAMEVVQKTDVYKEAFKRVQNSAEVQAALGTPIEPGWTFLGSVNYKDDSGRARFRVPVSGPKGEGTLNVRAAKAAGAGWKYGTLEVELPGGQKVDLRGEP